MVLPYIQIPTHFLCDTRPGRNCEHIAEHGMTPDLWEDVFRRATRHGYDKEDETVHLPKVECVGSGIGFSIRFS